MLKIESLHYVSHGDGRCVLNGQSQEAAAKIIVTAQLKMEDAYILTRIAWTLKKGLETYAFFQAPSCVPVA
jgi:hypothetical protein